MQRKRQELQPNLLCLSVQVSAVSSFGLFTLPTLWKGIFPRVFYLPCLCWCGRTRTMGQSRQGLPFCGKVTMLQEWGRNWEFWPKHLVQGGEVPWRFSVRAALFSSRFASFQWPQAARFPLHAEHSRPGVCCSPQLRG